MRAFVQSLSVFVLRCPIITIHFPGKLSFMTMLGLTKKENSVASFYTKYLVVLPPNS